jgi:hypothetical protein
MGMQRVRRYFYPKAIDANALAVLREVVNENFSSDRKYRLVYPTEEIEVNSWDDLQKVFAKKGPTARFQVFDKASAGRTALFDTTHPSFILVELSSAQLDLDREIEKIVSALSLKQLRTLLQSAFLAHGFDDKGRLYATEVRAFLELIGITVCSGEYYKPGSVSEKVKRQITDSDLFIAIVTPQDDQTWIVQETTFAESNGKRPIVLIEDSIESKRGLRGDYEDIFFPDGHISESFIKILQGLRELRADRG